MRMRLFGALLICLCLFPLAMASSASAEKTKNFAGAKQAGEVSAKLAPSNAAVAWLSYYRGEQNEVDYKTISTFIKNHPDFPAMNTLCEEAEKAMPSSISDEDAIAWFGQNPPQTTFGVKTYSQALTDKGDFLKANAVIKEWWTTSSLKPNDQSKGYMAFSTVLNKGDHEKRLRMLLHKQQYTNARSLAEALGGGYKSLTEARIGLQTGKGNVNALLSRVPDYLQNDEGLLFDRLYYRRKVNNDAGALEILNNQPSYEKMFDSEDWGKERGIIARRLFEQRKYGQAYRVSAQHGIKKGTGFSANEWMAGWLALEYLSKPWDAFEHFERLYHGVETPISKSRAAYWAGLASENLGHKEVAVKWYTAAARHTTTFYGQLASVKLGYKDKVQTISYSANPALKGGSLAAAAKWLKKNGYKTEAGMFLTKMIELSHTPQDFAAAAETANDMGMKNYAIKAAQEGEKKNGTAMVGYAFPKIEKYMGNTNVEWALVHALVRQESRYDTEAVSSAGARGLMQLMPRTAKEVAQKAGLSHQQAWLTSKPEHNVALGSRYLNQLLSKYDGNYAMALAAYNAGPGRVDKWIKEIGDPRNPKVDLVNWIEMIPIYETRNYVQRVLEGVYVYRQTLSKNNGNMNGINGVHIASQ